MVKVYHLEFGGQSYEVGVEKAGSKTSVTVDGKKRFVDLARLNGSGAFSILLDGRSFDLEVKESEKGLLVFALGQQFDLIVEEERAYRARLASGGGKTAAREKEARAPMPGLIVKIEVAVGQVVEPGQGLLIMEAMKMENEIKAKGTGKVKEIKVAERQPVEQNQVLITFE
ncbi:MAG: acetyl-CoA carboxylase biotin carboxyl carrier protein subunit [candidate division Zixibacteria bacterium]|nr:acetyl-CoA carboxylase biotin carboxyl carrier protein subunit [candidate division Zixibacteria bacterium]